VIYMNIKILCIDGSPRVKGNTEILIDIIKDRFIELGASVDKIKLSNLDIKPCVECRKCLEEGICCINDDIRRIVFPKLFNSDIIVVASPVYFNNVSSYVKIFMDRTWSIRGKLKNKVGGAVVVGRGYGLEQALQAIYAWMIKHRMIIGCPGLQGEAFEKGEILNDERALSDVGKFVKRLYEISILIKGTSK